MTHTSRLDLLPEEEQNEILKWIMPILKNRTDADLEILKEYISEYIFHSSCVPPPKISLTDFTSNLNSLLSGIVNDIPVVSALFYQYLVDYYRHAKFVKKQKEIIGKVSKKWPKQLVKKIKTRPNRYLNCICIENIPELYLNSDMIIDEFKLFGNVAEVEIFKKLVCIRFDSKFSKKRCLDSRIPFFNNRYVTTIDLDLNDITQQSSPDTPSVTEKNDTVEQTTKDQRLKEKESSLVPEENEELETNIAASDTQVAITDGQIITTSAQINTTDGQANTTDLSIKEQSVQLENNPNINHTGNDIPDSAIIENEELPSSSSIPETNQIEPVIPNNTVTPDIIDKPIIINTKPVDTMEEPIDKEVENENNNDNINGLNSIFINNDQHKIELVRAYNMSVQTIIRTRQMHHIDNLLKNLEKHIESSDELSDEFDDILKKGNKFLEDCNKTLTNIHCVPYNMLKGVEKIRSLTRDRIKLPNDNKFGKNGKTLVPWNGK